MYYVSIIKGIEDNDLSKAKVYKTVFLDILFL